jgi:hypothetical protein
MGLENLSFITFSSNEISLTYQKSDSSRVCLLGAFPLFLSQCDGFRTFWEAGKMALRIELRSVLRSIYSTYCIMTPATS